MSSHQMEVTNIVKSYRIKFIKRNTKNYFGKLPDFSLGNLLLVYFAVKSDFGQDFIQAQNGVEYKENDSGVMCFMKNGRRHFYVLASIAEINRQNYDS